MSEAVDHPKHYNSHRSGVEAIEICEHLSFNVGNAVKYLFRCDHKGSGLEDLRKAAWYLKRAAERDERVDVSGGGYRAQDAARDVISADPSSLLSKVLDELLLMQQTSWNHLGGALELVAREIEQRGSFL